MDIRIKSSWSTRHANKLTNCKSSYRYGLALSKPNLDKITTQFCGKIIEINNDRKYKINLYSIIPDGITPLICMFHGFYCVYSTGMDTTGGAGHGISNNYDWIPMKTFENKNIMKIASGARHSMFLESKGVL